jgi:hypothetical protein
MVTALTAAARSGDAAVVGEACEVLCIWAVLPHPAWDRLLARDEKLLLAMLQDVSKLLHTPVSPDRACFTWHIAASSR